MDIRHRMRTAHVLNGSCTGQGPQVRVADPRELCLDGLQHVARNLQTGISRILALAKPVVATPKIPSESMVMRPNDQKPDTGDGREPATGYVDELLCCRTCRQS